MYRSTVLMCLDTCCTFSEPFMALPVPALFPREYQDSIPGRIALNPFFFIRTRWGSERRERLLSARKSMLPGGMASSITFM